MPIEADEDCRERVENVPCDEVEGVGARLGSEVRNEKLGVRIRLPEEPPSPAIEMMAAVSSIFDVCLCVCVCDDPVTIAVVVVDAKAGVD